MLPTRNRQPFRSVENTFLPRAFEPCRPKANHSGHFFDNKSSSKKKATASTRTPFRPLDNNLGTNDKNRFNACLPRAYEQTLKQASRDCQVDENKIISKECRSLKNTRTTKKNNQHLNRYINATRKTQVVVLKSNYGVIIDKPTKAKTNPSDDFLNRFNKVKNRYTSTETSYIDIRGAIQEGDSESREDFDLDAVTFTEKQVRRIRVLILPSERCAVIDDMGKLILGQEFGRRRKVFGPGFWHSLLRSYDTFKQLLSDTVDPFKLFNMFFGFTYQLSRNPRWMTHGWSRQCDGRIC